MKRSLETWHGQEITKEKIHSAKKEKTKKEPELYFFIEHIMCSRKCLLELQQVNKGKVPGNLARFRNSCEKKSPLYEKINK